jgi:hypothetical protein
LFYDGAASAILKIKDENTETRFDVLDIIPGEGSIPIQEIRMNFRISGDITIDYREVINFFRVSFYIPDGFIPTRWSEFEFWSETLTFYGGAVKYYFSMKAYAPDLEFRSYMLKIIVFAGLFFVCFIAAAILGIEKIKEKVWKAGNVADK